jgi:hypothetical protein
MQKMDILRTLYEYFPTAVDTGECLVFISDEWKVELWEHKKPDFGTHEPPAPSIRVKVFRRTISGSFIPDHYLDFKISPTHELANQIERYIQFAIGKTIRENG